MFAASHTSCLLKISHTHLAKNSIHFLKRITQPSCKGVENICLAQSVRCSSSNIKSSSDLKQIEKPRSIKKYFAFDSSSSSVLDGTKEPLAPETQKTPEDDRLEASSSSVHQGSWNVKPTSKYEQFDARGSRIIYDLQELQQGINVQPVEFEPLAAPEVAAHFEPVISLERGKTGVFDVEELVQLLQSENGRDVVTMKIPAEMVFVDHMVVVSASSQRHLDAVAQAVRQHYNKKKSNKDPGLILEGRDSPWVAMDLGNIALHIMSPSERRRIDLEGLWLCGPEHDLKLLNMAKESLDNPDDDFFFLVDTDPTAAANVDPEAYDITKEYIHPFVPVHEHDVLPDYDEINETNINTYPATSVMEMALVKHNKGYARKYRGRFKK